MLYRFVSNASHWNIRWPAVSSSTPHIRHFGGSFIIPILWRCALKFPWPVIRLTMSLICFLFKLRIAVLLLGHGLGIISLPCLCFWMFTQCFACCLCIQHRSPVFTVILVMPKTGSGPTKGVCAPILASLSAFSLPSIPEWLGTHAKVTLLHSPSLSRTSWQSLTSCDLISQAFSAFRAAWLSITLYPIKCLI